jgi:uncharacterized protein (DUF885 family)
MVATQIQIFSKPLHYGKSRHSEFFERKYERHYWTALLEASKGNMDLAKEIVNHIRTNTINSLSIAHENHHGKNIDTFFDYLFLTFVAKNPQRLSSIGLFESIGVNEHNKYLNDVTPQAMMQDAKDKKACLHTLHRFDISTLTQDQQTSYKVFEWMLNDIVAGEKFLFHEYKINQMFGIILDLTLLFTQFHVLNTTEDIENYITRLSKIPTQIDQTIQLIEFQKNNGIVPPQFAIQKTINILENMMPITVTENALYCHLSQRINEIQNIDTEALLQQAQAIISQRVYPSLDQLARYCRTLLESVTDNNGVWALPDGDDYYNYILQHHTTTSLTAEEIHEIGLQEVQKIQNEMREIFALEGIINPEKTIGQLLQELALNPQFYYPQTNDGRAQCIAHYQSILERCRTELYPLFDLKPQSPVAILPVPKHEQEGQAAAYYLEPSIDGSRPGTFFINLRDMQENPTYRMETLAVHEAEPGHHFQIALQQESSMPILRKLCDFTAFVEGWALYAEKLAYEQGFYSSSFSKLGHLQDELLRAVRLVVDTGIHKKRWTREEAINYMEKATGYDTNNITTEVERYFVFPGQACSYKIGQLKILELRQRAKNTLGYTFDIREFHNVILTLGAAPLSLLEEVVDQYIAKKLDLK